MLNLTALMWTHWNPLVELTLLTVLVLTGLGFYDDYAKIVQQHGGGAKPHVKLWVQVAVAVFVALYIWQLPVTSTLPFPESPKGWRNNLDQRGDGAVLQISDPCGCGGRDWC